MAVAMPAKAQLKWGVKGGVNIAKLKFDKISYKDNTTGFFIGPMAEVTVPIVGLGVDASLLYNQNGSDEYKQAGIDIPVNLKYTFGLGSKLGIFVAAGPDFFFNFKGDDDAVDKYKSMVGVNIGAGVKLINHLQIGVNYNAQLGKSGEVSLLDAVSFSKYKFNTWQISAAYIF